jgi:hypothetical protein
MAESWHMLAHYAARQRRRGDRMMERDVAYWPIVLKKSAVATRDIR